MSGKPTTVPVHGVCDAGAPGGAGFVRCVLPGLALLLCGCARMPSIVLFGAAFPDWLFCMIGGVIATVAVHRVLGATRRVSLLEPLPLSYPALTAIFAVLIWLLVFHQ